MANLGLIPTIFCIGAVGGFERRVFDLRAFLLGRLNDALPFAVVLIASRIFGGHARALALARGAADAPALWSGGFRCVCSDCVSAGQRISR